MYVTFKCNQAAQEKTSRIVSRIYIYDFVLTYNLIEKKQIRLVVHSCLFQ